jgi:hypothetical protein
MNNRAKQADFFLAVKDNQLQLKGVIDDYFVKFCAMHASQMTHAVK